MPALSHVCPPGEAQAAELLPMSSVQPGSSLSWDSTAASMGELAGGRNTQVKSVLAEFGSYSLPNDTVWGRVSSSHNLTL